MDMYALAGLGGASGFSAGASPASAPSAAAPAASDTGSSRAMPPPGWGGASSVATRFVPPNLSAAKKAATAKPKPTASTASVASIALGGPSAAPLATNSWFKDVKDLYDPVHPNDYDDYVREMEAVRKAKERAEMEAALQAKQAETSRKLSSLTAGADLGGATPALPPPPPPPGDMAPPSLPGLGQGRGRGALQPARVGDETKRQRVSPTMQPSAAPELPSGVLGALEGGASEEAVEADPGLSMLVKMGWKDGQGLGKDGQGMRTPLMAKKTDSATGVIVNAAERPMGPRPNLPPPPDLPPPSGPAAPGGAPGGGTKGAVTFRGRPSRVLLLKNMVGPGEVDDDLSGEIGEECSKYGEVLKVTVYELPPTEAPSPEEAVRIFVQFAKQAAAMKAYIDLDGRFFGGRSVWVAFFAEADFEAALLAPSDKEPK